MSRPLNKAMRPAHKEKETYDGEAKTRDDSTIRKIFQALGRMRRKKAGAARRTRKRRIRLWVGPVE
jgi:hypothetical protein